MCPSWLLWQHYTANFAERYSNKEENISNFTFRSKIFRDVLIMSQHKLIKALGTFHGQSANVRLQNIVRQSEIYLLSINRGRADWTKYAKFPTEPPGSPINWYDRSSSEIRIYSRNSEFSLLPFQSLNQSKITAKYELFVLWD